MTQLDIFTASDQSFFLSDHWGMLDFFPAKTDKWKDTCRHCLLWDSVKGETPDCANAPCCAHERADGCNGYYSIHHMPHHMPIERRKQ